MAEKQTIVEGPSASSEHRTPAVPETYKSPLGDEDQSTGTADGLLGESSPDAVGAAPESAVAAGSPTVPPESDDAAGVQPGQSDSHLQRAAAYDWLMQDPQLAAMINDNVSARLGQTPQSEAPATPAAPAGDSVSRAEFAKLQQDMTTVANQAASQTIRDFQTAHPDFSEGSQVRNITGAIVQQYGLPLEQAYHLANVQLNGGNPVAANGPATVAPAESGPGGGGSRQPTGTVDVMDDVQEKIERLPQSPRRFEDALNLVIKGAIKKHATN